MNIFLSDPDPRLCAQALDDKRVVKMALESAQLLATALESVGHNTTGYKPTHTVHPCSLWAARSRGNFLWLIEHGLELCLEYEFRYQNKVHKSKGVMYEAFNQSGHIPAGGLTFDFNSSGFNTGDVFHDYKLCLVNKWRYIDGFVSPRSRKPVWSIRGAPVFKRELWNADFNNPPQVGD